MSRFEHSLARGSLFSGGVASSLGFFTDAVSVGSATIGGFFAQPLKLPVDFDRSRPAGVIVTLFNPSAAVTPGGDVFLVLAHTISTPTSAAVNSVTKYVVPIPNLHPTMLPIYVDVTPAALPLFPARTLPLLATLGLRIARLGGDRLDTWAGTLGLVAHLTLWYNRLCTECHCP